MSVPSLIKQPSESRLFAMDFSANLAAGESLASVVSVTVDKAGLTITDPPTYGGTKAQQRISGGTAETRYKVTFVVTTSAGNTLEGEGILQVMDL